MGPYYEKRKHSNEIYHLYMSLPGLIMDISYSLHDSANPPR